MIGVGPAKKFVMRNVATPVSLTLNDVKCATLRTRIFVIYATTPQTLRRFLQITLSNLNDKSFSAQSTRESWMGLPSMV